MRVFGFVPEDNSSWKASWISRRNRMDVVNIYVLYRKEFHLKASPVKAEIKISADTRYHLRINGVYVCRGPAKGYPEFQPYDRVDITKYLKKGRNCIGAVVNSFGVSTYSNIWRNRTGLIIDGQAEFDSTNMVRLDTGKGWKCLKDPARGESGRLSIQQGFQEIYDGRKTKLGWAMPGFDDSAWEKAEVLGPAGIPPWFNMEERGTPMLREETAYFCSVEGYYAGSQHPLWRDGAKLSEILSGEKRSPCKNSPIKVCLTGGEAEITVNPVREGRFFAVVLALPKASVGCPELSIESAGGGEIIDLNRSMRHPDDPYFIDSIYNFQKLHDRYVTRKGSQQFRTFSFVGYRRLMLIFRDVKKPLKVKVSHHSVHYPVKKTGEFFCSDGRLNDIWKMSRRTLECCMLDSYVDCPDREQAQWMGDALIESEANYYSFGDTALIKRMIRQCAQSQIGNGLMYGVFPGEAHKNILPDFNFTWFLTAEKYYEYTGDSSILYEIYPAAEKNLKWFEKEAGERKLLGNPEGCWLFLDWSPIYKEGISSTYNLWYLLALRAMQRISKTVGMDASRYKRQEEALKKALLKMFYVKNGSFWKDGYDLDKKKALQAGQHANALASLAGLPFGSKGEKLLRLPFTVMNDFKSPRASPYFSYFVLDALFLRGQGASALDSIRKNWGSMLDSGLTTCTEQWDSLDSGMSVCHAWSSHPLILLSKYVLGLKLSGTAWRKYDFDPFTDGKIKWAKGVVPVPGGRISAEWQFKSGKIIGSSSFLPDRRS